MNQPAVPFLTRSFAFSETIAILLRRDDGSRPQHRIVTVEQVLQGRYLAWLAHQNQAGWNIYASANPLLPGSRKRTTECVASVRHLYVDIDTDGHARLAALLASDRVPSPTAILSTSHGKYQALWRVAEFDFERQERTLKLLASAFGGDAACTDRNRLLRLPGFTNQKYLPAHPITVEYPAEKTYLPADFRLDDIAAFPFQQKESETEKLPPQKHSRSEDDWAWILSELRRGKDAGKLARELAIRRADKPNPLYYAQRTVDLASARLWLADRIPISDVITMLEARRRFEIPDPISSARAREIALTAQRMIDRRNTCLSSQYEEKHNATA
jgi:hypothetical protein